jgi:hypothetical protein
MATGYELPALAARTASTASLPAADVFRRSRADRLRVLASL